MTYTATTICTVILAMLSLLGGVKGNPAAVNAREFNALCILALIADKAQDLTEDEWLRGLVDWNEVNRTYEKINKMIDQTNSSEKTIKLTPDDGELELGDEQTRNHVRNLLATVERSVRKIKEESGQLAQGALDDIRQAKTDALKAISVGGNRLSAVQAEVGSEYKSGSGPATRGTSCAKGASCSKNSGGAGCSLLGDIMCLCAPGGSSSKHNHAVTMCGARVSGTGAWHSSGIDDTLATDVWVPLKNACEATYLDTRFTPENIRRGIDRFHTLLGAHNGATPDSNAERHRWILGKPQGAGSCAGSQNGLSDMCVNYADTEKNYNLMEIPWLQKLDTAMRKLEDAEKKAKQVREKAIHAQAVLTATENNLNSINIRVKPPDARSSDAQIESNPKRSNMAGGQVVQKGAQLGEISSADRRSLATTLSFFLI